MSTVDVDSRGRIYIPKDIREELGEKFKIVKLDSGIKLIPVDDDPIEGLKKGMKDSEDLEIEEISEEAAEKARKELEEEY